MAQNMNVIKEEYKTLGQHLFQLYFVTNESYKHCKLKTNVTLGTRGNSLAKSGRPSLTSDRTLAWPAGFSKRVASGTQGKQISNVRE